MRLQILSRKISNRAINEAGLEDCKIQYFKFMVRYFIHEKEMLEASKAYQTIYDTINKATPELTKELDPTGGERKLAFQNFVLFLMLTPFTAEKVELMAKVDAMYPRELEAEDLLGKFMHKLQTFELMPLNEAEIESQLSQFEPFQESVKNHKAHSREFVKQLI